MSFSTKGSPEHDNVSKVHAAVKILKDRNVKFVFDGQLQADAALVPSVTDQKAPGSPVKGKVNTLVFPDLGAGNIGYKLVQRLGNAQAFGPLLQGIRETHKRSFPRRFGRRHCNTLPGYIIKG